jgi:hypothetical protein
MGLRPYQGIIVVSPVIGVACLVSTYDDLLAVHVASDRSTVIVASSRDDIVVVVIAPTSFVVVTTDHDLFPARVHFSWRRAPFAFILANDYFLPVAIDLTRCWWSSDVTLPVIPSYNYFFTFSIGPSPRWWLSPVRLLLIPADNYFFPFDVAISFPPRWLSGGVPLIATYNNLFAIYLPLP